MALVVLSLRHSVFSGLWKLSSSGRSRSKLFDHARVISLPAHFAAQEHLPCSFAIPSRIDLLRRFLLLAAGHASLHTNFYIADYPYLLLDFLTDKSHHVFR